MIKGNKFFAGGSIFDFCQNLSLSTKQRCWESYSWIFYFFFTLKTATTWLHLLPHDWAWQMKHWRKCLYPRAPEPADCAAVLGFLHKIRPCTEDFYRYPSSRTRLLDCLLNSTDIKKYQQAILLTEGLELYNIYSLFCGKNTCFSKCVNK